MLLAASAALGLAMAAAPSRAGGGRGKPPWLTLDRIDAEPSIFPGHGRLRLYASAIEINGRVIHADKWNVTIGGARIAPDFLGRYRDVESELAVVILVQGSEDFEKALPLIKEQLKRFVQRLPRRTQIAVASFGDSYKPPTFADGPTGAQRHIDKLTASGTGEPVLLKSVGKAIDAFKKVKPKVPGASMRKIIVVIGEGRDPEPDPRMFKNRGTRADAAGVRIHTIAFHPPLDASSKATVLSMYGLGELSKWANGTLRLVRTQSAESFEPQLDSLLEEIDQQYVLTAFVPTGQLELGSTVLVSTNLGGTSTSSTRLKFRGLSCGGEACVGARWCNSGACVAFHRTEGRGVLGWVLLLAGLAIGGVVILGAVGWALVRRRARRDDAAAQYAQIAGAAAAASAPPLDPNRIVPQGPQGQVVAPTAPRTAGHAAWAPPSGAHAAIAGQVPAAGLAPVGQHAAAAFPVPGAGRTLLVLNGPHEGRRLPLRHGFRIGKAPGNDLDLAADGFASTNHAQILMDAAGNCTLVDRGSTNGTYVNGVRVTADLRLSHGMLIRVGSTDVRFLEQ